MLHKGMTRRIHSIASNFLKREQIPIIAASFVVGLSLAISVAELFVPLFWERRLFIRLGFIVTASALLTALIVPITSKLKRNSYGPFAPVNRFFRLLISLAVCVMATIIIIHSTPYLFQRQLILNDRISGEQSRVPIAVMNQPVDIALVCVFVLFLAIANSVWIDEILNSRKRVFYPVIFLVSCFLAISYINNILPLINTRGWSFKFPTIIPAALPVGVDFRNGVYRPANLFLSGGNIYSPKTQFHNIYPPLVTALGIPYLLLDENSAYMLHIFLLFIANVATLVLASSIITKSFVEHEIPDKSDFGLGRGIVFVLVLFSLFSGYPFLFSFERGNIDIIAIFFVIASIWVLLKYPTRIWLQIILLSIAVHLKIYPVVAFVILFFVHRSRIILPAILVNLALLCILGPANAFGFFRSLLNYVITLSTAQIYNHSAHSFAGLVIEELHASLSVLPIFRIILTCIPLIICVLGLLALRRIKNRKAAIVSGFMISVPLMEVVPPISYDYKLVILSSAILILLTQILLRMWVRQELSGYIQLFTVSTLILFINRSYLLMPQAPNILANKYLPVVLLEVLMMVNIYQQLHDSPSESTSVTSSRSVMDSNGSAAAG